jgi:hypothetical protein
LERADIRGRRDVGIPALCAGRVTTVRQSHLTVVLAIKIVSALLLVFDTRLRRYPGAMQPLAIMV